MTVSARIMGALLIIAAGIGLCGCSLIRPALVTDAQDRICNRSGDRKAVAAAAAVHPMNQGIIEGCNWEFDQQGRAFLALHVHVSASGTYDIALDFHEPFEDLRIHASLGSVAAGRKETFRIGPLPHEFPKPAFAEVSVLLLTKDASGGELLIDEVDTYFLVDTDRVNDAALKGLDSRGLTAQALLNQYAPVLKTDVVANPNTGIVYVDLPPKNIAAILSGSPDKNGQDQAMVKCDLWKDHVSAEPSTSANRREFNGRKDDYFIDLPQPFASMAHPWREIVGRYPNAVYGRLVRAELTWEGVLYRDAVILQYWMPYYVNHLSILKTDLQGKSWIWNAGNYHEGEAENIAVVLIPGEEGFQPLCAAYSKHFKGTAEPWANVRKHAPGGVPTTHPVVYVANGSHASFFSPDPGETSCGNGVDAVMHAGGGFWYDEGDLGQVRMMPRVNDIKFGDEFDFLLFTGRFGGSYIEGAANLFNRSPYMFPYTLYPRFSMTGNWVAGSGINRWIDPASEIRYQAKIPSRLGYDHRKARLQFDTTRVRIKKEAGRIRIEELDLIAPPRGSSPAESVAVFFRDRKGNLRKLAAFAAGAKPPSPLYIPMDAVHKKGIELVACDIVIPPPAKPPLSQINRQGTFEYFLMTTVNLEIR
ncbi:MAG: hypothetical protein EG826_06165 [Deltaproteobacteria bacterium]|nr:hypothetical protein [Deltaproteobacteria bacterium]